MNAPISPIMLAAIMADPAAVFVDARGPWACYRTGDRCGGCGRTHWIIGRSMAECGFCAAAVPLERPLNIG